MNNQIVCRVFKVFFWISMFNFNKTVEISFIKSFKTWIFRFNCCFWTKNSDLILNFHLKSLLYLNSCLNDLSSEMKSVSEMKAKSFKAKSFCVLFERIIMNWMKMSWILIDKDAGCRNKNADCWDKNADC